MTIQKKVTIKNKSGLHARPAALFVETANRFESEIIVQKGGQKVNGKSIMGIMMLAAEKGSKVLIIATGTDAQDAVRELESLLLGEEV
jgi:phosphocarrier protein HPr